MDLKKLAELHGKTLDEMEEVLKNLGELKGKSDPSEDDTTKIAGYQKRYEELKGKADGLEQDIMVAKDMADRRVKTRIASDLAKPDDKPGAPYSGKSGEEDEADEAGRKIMADYKAKTQKQRELTKYFWDYMQVGKDAKIPDKAIDDLRPQGKGWTDAADGVKLPSHMAQLVIAPNLVSMAQSHQVYASLQQGMAAMYRGKAEAVGDNPFITTDVNFPTEMFPPEFMAELLQLPPEPFNLFQRVRRVPTKTGTVRWPKLTQTDANEFGTIAVNWINEASEKPLTEPSFEQVLIQTHELAARTEMSRTLINRSIIDMEAFLAMEFRAAIMNELDSVFQTGSGVGQPLGVFNTAGVRAVARQTANTVTYEDLVEMEHSLRINHRANAVWLMSDDVMKILRKTLDNEGRPLFVPNPTTGAFDTIFGKPVISTHRLTLGEDDVLLGDWRQYISPLETDVVVMRSEHRKIEDNIIVFVVFIQTGGRAVQERAFVRLGDTSGS